MLESEVVSRQVGPNFSRRHGRSVLTWDPPQSLLRIEYASGLLREVRAAGASVDAFGPLFGIRRGQTIRLLATQGRAGLQRLGAFASRLHGGVCLTEEDLQRFDEVPACAMLVISGESAGFFVREKTGTIGAVCNYREVAAPESARPVDAPSRPWRLWIQIATTASLIVMTMLLAVMPLRRGKPPSSVGGKRKKKKKIKKKNS